MVIAGRRSYLDMLDEAWAQHLAPREIDAPTVVSLFAGCGGSSLGYSMAGYRELLAVEWADMPAQTFRLNFPDVPLYHGDIAALGDQEALALAGIESGMLDVLDGSPPCQGFSTAGKRMLDDPRNGLFREYVRLLRAFQPRAFVMENVSGMVKGKMKLVFAEILRALKTCGYRVSARLLNAMYFGVPQSRARMIFVGIREDLGILPSHPKAGIVNSARVVAPILEVRQGWGPRRLISPRNEEFENKWRSANLPCPTITRSRAPIAQFENGETRELSAMECSLFGSFPAAYCWPSEATDSLRVAQIGNSVPPLFMRAIAQHCRMLLGATP